MPYRWAICKFSLLLRWINKQQKCKNFVDKDFDRTTVVYTEADPGVPDLPCLNLQSKKLFEMYVLKCVFVVKPLNMSPKWVLFALKSSKIVSIWGLRPHTTRLPAPFAFSGWWFHPRTLPNKISGSATDIKLF